MQKQKYLLKVRRSRKSYLLFYFMVFLILILIGYLYYQGYSLSALALWVSFLFVLFTVKLIELHRLKDWWAITNNGIVQSTGIFNKNIREIDFSSISDLDLDQSFFKRILNYGNINVRLFLNETSIKIIDINKPVDFIEELQTIISMNRGSRNGLRKV